MNHVSERPSVMIVRKVNRALGRSFPALTVHYRSLPFGSHHLRFVSLRVNGVNERSERTERAGTRHEENRRVTEVEWRV